MFREAVEDIVGYKNDTGIDGVLKEMFGYEYSPDVTQKDRDTSVKGQGTGFFSNATLPVPLQKKLLSDEAIEKKLSRYFYRRQSSTAIDESNLARKYSLRHIETVVPCELSGYISDILEEILPYIREASGYIKRIGYNRNRGLGRCRIEITGEGEQK